MQLITDIESLAFLGRGTKKEYIESMNVLFLLRSGTTLKELKSKGYDAIVRNKIITIKR